MVVCVCIFRNARVCASVRVSEVGLHFLWVCWAGLVGCGWFFRVADGDVVVVVTVVGGGDSSDA